MSSSLHNHSEYSVLDGFSHPKEYLDRAQEIGLKAFAITEHGNQYSWVYFDELKNQYPDIKMIYGVELYECSDIAIKDKDSKYFHLVALAKNEAGRVALNEVITRSNFDGFYYKPRVDINMLKPYADNLIILSACLASKIARENDYAKCLEYVNEYNSIFPYFFLEMQSHNTEEQAAYNQKILRLAKETNVDFVITTDSHAATKEDLYYQARHVQIAHDDETMSEVYSGCYIQTDEEIHEIMDRQIGRENVMRGLTMSDRIADMIEEVNMPFQDPQLPTFPLPEGYASNFDYLKYLTEIGWKKRKLNQLSSGEQRIRRERLEYELEVIHKMNYDGYFLIVWDFINYAKKNGITVGDGRGSGGGAIVNYLLGISELDPIQYDLIFERFLNPERVSMPDIDVDVADRDKVIAYLMNKYGEERVCQVINFSYITPIVAVKDVGRILGIPYSVCDKISKKFTYDTFDECMHNNPDVVMQYAEHAELFEIASKISGRVRNVSIHAGGVGIVDTRITDYMGMKLGSKNEHVIQVDKKKVEAIGIVKFDILGVSTLSVVQEVMREAKISPEEISIDNPSFASDEQMFKLLQSARTDGVFQVESQGMKDLLARLNPTSLEDVSAVLALYRPDSMGMLEDYIYYKHNPKQIKYWHPDMEPILKKTYGCIIYQEEIMDIVRKFGGRTYGGADKFRKGIGKKNVKLVKQEADALYYEIIDNGYSEELAKQISEYMSKMGGYSFNKSHSALYAILTLKTAYLKAHYPAYFFCALLNKNKDNYGLINKYILDAKSFGVEILPPHINKSDRNFKVVDGKILFGLSAIKNVGENLVNAIIGERENGSFCNYNDFISRVSLSTSQIVSLIKAGAIPCSDKKEFLMNYARSIFQRRDYKAVSSLPTLSVQKDKYGIDTNKIKGKDERLKLYNEAKKSEFARQQKQKYEKHMTAFSEKYMQDEDFWEFETLSVFIGNNPFDDSYHYISKTYDDVEDDEEGVLVGVIAKIQKKKDRNKNQYAYLNIYSSFGLVEVICWSSQYKRYEDLIKRGSQIAMIYRKNNDQAVVKEMKPYQQWLEDREIKSGR